MIRQMVLREGGEVNFDEREGRDLAASMVYSSSAMKGSGDRPPVIIMRHNAVRDGGCPRKVNPPASFLITKLGNRASRFGDCGKIRVAAQGAHRLLYRLGLKS